MDITRRAFLKGLEMDMERWDLDKFKPLVKDFIKFYYDELGNVTGGYLHIVLDDGNINHETIYWCQTECEKHKDTFGYFLATLLRHFTEDELFDMYEKDWWGMRK